MVIEGYYYRQRGVNDSPASGSQLLDVVRLENPKLSQKYLPLGRLTLWFKSAPGNRLLLLRAVRTLKTYVRVLQHSYYMLSPGERSLAKVVAHELGQYNPAQSIGESGNVLMERYWGWVFGKSLSDNVRQELAYFQLQRHIQWGTIGNPCLRDKLADEYEDFVKEFVRNRCCWVSPSDFQNHFERKYPPEIWGDPRGHIYIAAARANCPNKTRKIVEITNSYKASSAVTA